MIIHIAHISDTKIKRNSKIKGRKKRTRLIHVVDQRRDAAVGDDELRELRRVLAHLANGGRRVFPHEPVDVLQAHQYARENLRLDNYFRKVHRVLRDLPERGAHLPLELGVRG